MGDRHYRRRRGSADLGRSGERQDAFERWILIQSKREPLFPTDLTMNSDWSRYVSAQTQAYWLAFEAGADFGFMQG